MNTPEREPRGDTALGSLRRLRMLLIAALVALVLLWSFTHLTVLGQRADGDPLWPVVQLHWSYEDEARTLRRWLPLLSGAVAVVLALPHVRSHHWQRLQTAIVVPTLSIILAELLKAMLIRPDLGPAGFANNSFPSSNAVAVASLWVSAWILASVRVRPLIAVTGTAVTMLAMISSVTTYAHRISDVLGSVILVLAVTAAVGLLSRPRENRPGPSR